MPRYNEVWTIEEGVVHSGHVHVHVHVSVFVHVHGHGELAYYCYTLRHFVKAWLKQNTASCPLLAPPVVLRSRLQSLQS